MSYFQSQRSECKIESYYTSGKQKKIDCFIVDGFCAHYNTVFEAMGCYFSFCPCQEAKATLSEGETHRCNRKRELDEMRRDHLKSGGYKIVEIWECKWWESVKEEENVRNHVRKNFLFKLPLKQESLLAKNEMERCLDTYNVIWKFPQTYNVIWKSPSTSFRISLLFLKISTLVEQILGIIREIYASQNNLLKQLQRMVISSFNLQNGTIITPLLNFSISLGLKCTSI